MVCCSFYPSLFCSLKKSVANFANGNSRKSHQSSAPENIYNAIIPFDPNRYMEFWFSFSFYPVSKMFISIENVFHRFHYIQSKIRVSSRNQFFSPHEFIWKIILSIWMSVHDSKFEAKSDARGNYLWPTTINTKSLYVPMIISHHNFVFRFSLDFSIFPTNIEFVFFVFLEIMVTVATLLLNFRHAMIDCHENSTLPAIRWIWM